jgi:uncharacterized delta-60 repeat protein
MKLNQLLKKRLYFLVIVLFPMLATAQQFGSIDTSFNIGEGPKNSYAGGAESAVNTIKLAPDGNIIVGGQFLKYNYAQKQLLVKLTPQGAVVSTFNIPTSNNLRYSAANEQTYEIEPLANGKLLVKGFMSDALSSNQSYRADRIYTLNSNGTLDENFTVNSYSNNRSIKNLEVTSDNKVLVVDPTIRRLNSNGINDPSFVTNLLPGYRVEVSKILANGKILLAGSFRTQFGTNENKVYRLLSNGRVDSTFSLSARANGSFRTLTTLTNGKILLSGSFTSYNGVAVNNVVRLNADGTNDNTFNISGSFNSVINVISELTDGSLIVGGSFTEYNGNPVSGLLKFDADGALVSSFNPILKNYTGGFTSTVNDVLVLPNGKLVIGGRFISVNGIRANNIALVNPNGRTDLEFNQFETVAPSIAKVIKEGNTGNWIVAGAFDTFNGHQTFGIARLLSNGSVDTTFKHSSNHISSFYSYEKIYGLVVNGSGNIYFSAQGKGYIPSLDDAALFYFSAALRPDGSMIETSILSLNEENTSPPKASTILLSTNNTLLIAESGVALIDLSRNTLLSNYGSGFTTNGVISTAQGAYDNKLMIGGNFTEAGGAPNNGIVRLLPNGQRDNTFSSASGANGTVRLIFPLQGGEYIVGGNFDFYSGIQRRGLAKVSNTGILNESFNANAGFQVAGAFPAELNAGVVLPNNQVIVAGNFTRFNGNITNRIICLDQEGNPVSNFQTTGADNTIHSIAQNNIGDILVAGDFTTFNNQGANYLVKLFGNGTPLTTKVIQGKLPMQVYPNPATDKLTIVSENGICNLTITDSQGKQVISRTIDGDAVISIATLKTGIYTLRLETAQGVAIQKVVKQ